MKKIMTKLLGSAVALVFSASAFALSPVGTWKTIDDETGEAKAHVQLYMNGNTLEGKITKILKDDPAALCEKCPGERKDKPVQGMVFMWGLKGSEQKWKKGKILDPKKGKIYKSKLTMAEDGQSLEVRGYIGTPLLGRSQKWVRVNK